RRFALCAALLALSASSTPRAQGGCAAEEARGHLGVAIACDCTVNAAPSAARPWRFRSAIRVDEVEAGGPADGVLRAGDVIVEAGGAAVTSAEGARRLWALRPGESIRLTVEREGRRMQVTLRAAAICPDDRRAIGSYAPAVVGGAIVPGVEPPTPGQPTPTPPAAVGSPSSGPVPVPDVPELRPEGWLGFGLACSQCGWAREAGDTAPYWESVGEPVLYAVQPGSPAARAGLREGDVLTHVRALPIASREGGRALGAVRPGERMALRVRRGGRTLEVEVVAGRRPAATAPPAVRWAGQVGGVRVELSGANPSDVSVDGETGEMSITLNGATVRLRPID
ncbi:MAG TPA: PDZ domain-containing protein, partial [Longimicrobium sp.]|nr:PDZ domain-containing protein [Longimicrobium sp.]